MFSHYLPKSLFWKYQEFKYQTQKRKMHTAAEQRRPIVEAMKQERMDAFERALPPYDFRVKPDDTDFKRAHQVTYEQSRKYKF